MITDQSNGEDDSQFYTFDLGLAASLVTSEFELLELNKTDRKKVQFIFSNNDELENIIDKYWKGHLKLDSRKLFENQKMLKNRIYSK